ncbi:YceI family protein [Flavobacterium sp.]|uniref:YceI family protein n=1 Tax=Flavobacterium sp. TaxID=239 RepID=UPI0037508AA0
MKKLFSLLFIFVFTISSFSQKIKTKSGLVNFDAVESTFEPVKALNKATTCILNTANGQIASQILMKGFEFKVALMEEHFNENYIESDKYPKATLKGKIENFDYSKITQTFQNIQIKGTLEMHGKIKDVIIDGKIKKNVDSTELTTNFILLPEDFDIRIPSIVRGKIAKKVNVSTVFLLK